jgi:hypothetical protein
VKGIIGVGAGWLQPGEVVLDEHGQRITIIRKVDLSAAHRIAERVGDTNFVPVPGEHFYEVDVDYRPTSNN